MIATVPVVQRLGSVFMRPLHEGTLLRDADHVADDRYTHTPRSQSLRSDLSEIERLIIALEALLRQVPGTRSTFAERQTGRE